LNEAIDYQGNVFSAEFDATPDAAAIDAVIGFADGPVDAFSDLAAAVRFNPDGVIDARDGDTYRVFSGPPISYQPGVTYRFQLGVDVTRARYSAQVTGADGSFSWLAWDAAFRPSQQGVLQLTHRGSIIDSASGGVSVCGYKHPYQDRCTRTDAGSGWSNRQAWPSIGTAFYTGLAKPTQANLDAVLGVSNGAADAFTDLAAIVRFNPLGQIDARDGSAYAALSPFAYQPGELYRVNMLLDLRQHTYTVIVDGVTIARDFAFRSEQANVAALDHDSTFIDSSSGGLILCNSGLTSSDRALYTVRSQAGILAVGANRRVYEMSGVSGTLTVYDTANGAALGTAPLRGRGATDAAGNLYLAGNFEQTYDPGSGSLVSSGGSDVFVAKYTPELVPLWGRAIGTAADEFFADLAVDGSGRVIVVGHGIGTVVLDRAGNTERQTHDFATEVATNAAGELALAGTRQGENGLEIWIEKRDPGGRRLWQNTYAPDEISSVALTDSGHLFFSGRFHGIVNFGGNDLRWTITSPEAPSSAGYLVKLSPNGEHVWSLQNDYHNQLVNLVADRVGNVTFAGTTGDQILYATVTKHAGADGAVLYRESLEPDRSTTQSIAADDSGAIYWSYTRHNYAQGTNEFFLTKLAP
jgi:hypothetical protein